mmetsp:Transcript_37084/g.37761  ORF Transcript_37084/g.37761 Transcript_37084/m.37761 type:complete len:144 (+) Transcript_37084:174-605(+)
MPLKNIPDSITPELLYALARMGHGDSIVIADANFPSDSVAAECILKEPIRVRGSTTDILRDVLHLLPLDSYSDHPVMVMDRVQSDKERNLEVVAYNIIKAVANRDIHHVERFLFYEKSKKAFCIVQTDDRKPYANVIVQKGVL